MFGLFCNAQPSYQTGGASVPVSTATHVPTAPLESLLGDLFSVFNPLWQATPRYEGVTTAPAAPPSPGFLCWLIGSPTPVYQTASATPTGTAITPRQPATAPAGGGNATGR